MQAARSPDAIALAFDFRDKETRRQGDKETTGRTTNADSVFSLQPPRGYPAFSLQLTYAELDRRANQLARHLQSLGVGPEVRVAVSLARSPELVIALLGVLKAGAAYVPLDSDYPVERLAFMLNDSQAAVLITSKDEGRRTNDEETLIDGLIVQRLLSIQNPKSKIQNPEVDSLAYVIYTSGSTGTPKGAMISHAAIVNRLLWMQATYVLDASDVVLQKTPFSFDVSVWEFFWPLVSGARLVLARPGGHQDSGYLADLIASQQVSTLHFVPTMLHVFLDEPGLERCDCLRRVICSGEALPVELQARCFSRLRAPLYNLYGPTEAAVDVTAWQCRPDAGQLNVPIGRPIANTQIYLLDRQLELVPVGVAGELFIGGVQLARGYLNRPDLTAERFVPNPFAATKDVETQNIASLPHAIQTQTIASVWHYHSSRLYRTGDRARYRPDGNIEYLGRLDGQVKLRGVRIEVGEIEAVLGQHPAVQACVVLLRADVASERRLVAYVVPTNEIVPVETQYIASVRLAAEHDPSIVHRPSSIVQELRSFLATRLPASMIPAAFVWLDALPVTPNGKIDRRALPAPADQSPESAVAFVAPRTPTEQVLAEVWSQVLGSARVGIYDNFFALGGDSMRSIRVLALARERGLDLALGQLFQYQTIHALSAAAAPAEPPNQQRIVHSAPFELIGATDRQRLPNDIEDAYPLSSLQAGMLFHSAYSPDTAIYHNINSVQVRGTLAVERLQRAVQQLVARHPILRTSFHLDGFSEPLQLVHRHVVVGLLIADLRALTPAARQQALASWMEGEKQRKFAWTQAPLLRFQVHYCDHEMFQFSWTEHHVLLDGWSVAAMLTELVQLYSAPDDAALLPPPRSLFRDFVALERVALASEEHRRYWLRTLRDSTITRLPRWPVERSGGLRQVRVHNQPLAETLVEQLQQLARRIDVPLKSMLLAVHLRVLSVVSGQRDLLTGLVTNSRLEEIDGERVLGLFLNSLPFRMRLRGGSWIELAQATFAAECELLPFRWYPLAELQRSMGGQPLFEALFTYINFHIYQQLPQNQALTFVGGNNYIETNYDFAIYFFLDQTQQLHLHLDYDPAVFAEQQIVAIGRYYIQALEALGSDPHGQYAAHDLLSAAERRQLLVEWNTTRGQGSGVRALGPGAFTS